MSSEYSSPSRAAGGSSLISGAVEVAAVSAIRSTSIGGLSKRRSPAVHWTERSAITTTCSATARSEEHTSELQSLMRISYAVFCLKKKMITTQKHDRITKSERTPTAAASETS